MLQRLARLMYRRRRWVLGGWIVLLVATFALSSGLDGAFKTEFRLPGTESQQAYDLLAKSSFRNRQVQAQIVFAASQGVKDPAVRQAMEQLFDEVDQKIANVDVASPYAPDGARQISRNGKIAYAQINFADRSGEAFTDAGKEIKTLAKDVKVDGLHIDFGGDIFADAEVGGASEAVGILAAMIILLIAFGSLLAMGLPIGTALFGIGTGIAIVLSVRTVVDMPNFTTAAVAMVGLGVGIDYALFIVTRYRENLGAGLDPERSVVHALDTAGRAVLFAGTTVVISVLGLLLMKTSIMRGVAIGISIGVLVTMLASVTLLPALLGFVGRNIDKFGLPHRKRPEGEVKESGWTRWSHVIQRHPWPAAILGLVFLLVLAVPLLSMRLGFTDAGNRPESDTTRQAYDLVAEGFGAGFNGPLLLATETPNGQADVDVLNQLAAKLNDTRGVAFATPPQPNPEGTVAVQQVFPTTDPQAKATADLVTHLRDDVIPSVVGDRVDVKVGGLTAAADDFAAYTAERLPVFMGAVLILSFLLLMLVFRSVLVPLKAVIMNLLSIGAAYGVVVAVFQWGWGSSLIGVGREAPVEAWAPVFIFAIVFGLSMDYEVFLLSRIREEYDRTGNNATAVADGLALTARVITAAALIMFFVFGSFVFGPEVALKLMGLGLAVAVLIDATVVRMVLVPATMELLGDWNWWLPKWLDRLLPRVHVEGASLDDELAALEESERTPVG
ncbi:MAG TPA: MMPL family transporter [Acidimicrobiia bacterium]|nr:MMPL family transporter [Acidimicrobiia bacterium]